MPYRNQAMSAIETRQRTYARMVKRLREFRELGFDEEEAVVDATLLLMRAYEASAMPGQKLQPIDERARMLAKRDSRQAANARARRAKAVA